jgi:hypothetical protein
MRLWLSRHRRISSQGENTMTELFLIRLFTYSIVPLLLAVGHILYDKETKTRTQQIELFMIYLLAISVGANGLGGAFGHLFYADVVAEAIGWQAGSPFQLEMGFANLTLGILGILAVGRRDGFRTATIIATIVIGFGATSVHLHDIIAHGNLSAGNTIQNIANLLDPILLIGLSWWATQHNDINGATFWRWHMRHGIIAGMTAGSIGIGFGIGYAVGWLLPAVLLSVVIGTATGWMMTQGIPYADDALATES